MIKARQRETHRYVVEDYSTTPLLWMDMSKKCAIKLTGIHRLNLGGYPLNTHTHTHEQ